jgi:hypothetical protein
VLAQNGKLTEAEMFHREALAMRKRMLGDNSPSVADSVNDLAAVLEKQGKMEEAEQVFHDALKVLRKTTRESPAVGLTVGRFADFLRRQKRLPEARSMAEEAVGLCLRHSSWPANERQHALEGLRTILTELGDLAGLEKFLRENLALERTISTNRPARLQGTITELASLLRSEKQYTDAEPLYRELLDYAWRDGTAKNSELESCLNNVASLLQKQGNRTNLDLFFKEIQARPIEAQSNAAELLEARASFFARWGQWKEAAADTSKLLQLRSTSHVPYHMMAPLLVAMEDPDAYRHHCRKAVAQFAATKDPAIADRMAKDCLILPSSGADLTSVCRLADKAVGAGASNRFLLYFQFGKGLAEYRRGNFESAAEWERKTIAGNRAGYNWDSYLYVEAYAVLAMAEHRLNHREQARSEFNKCVEMAAAKLPSLENGDLGTIWRDWIIARALLHEATDLVQAQTGTTLEAAK